MELWGAVDGKAYYKELQMLIRKHSLGNQVFLKGTTDNVPVVLKDGDIFAITSAYEGFGLSLGEAMSMGLPAVGYRSCSSVNELIQDGENGYLCEEGSEDFAEKLSKLMKNQDLRIAMGKQARVSMESYAPEKIWGLWEILLEKYGKGL